MTIKDHTSITVVIATRNRGSKINEGIESVLQNNYKKFNLIVIDQSTNEGTRESIVKYSKDIKFHYTKSDSVGLSKAKNLGIQNAKTEIIAITDDDCVVPKNWLQSIEDAFSYNYKIGIVFGNVLPGEYDNSKGFIPTHIRTQPCLVSSIYDKHMLEGISACTAIRKSMWEKLNGFDNMLGAGAYFKSAEESDLTVKALINGYSVFETPLVTVVHNGFRDWDEASKLIEAYWYGTGAMFAKHIKCGQLNILIVLSKLAYKWAFKHSRVLKGLGNKQYRLMRLYYFTKGFYSGLKQSVDRKKQLFVES